MKRKKILALPVACFWSVVGVCLLGIIIGSFCDFDISMALANQNEIGKYFAAFSPFLAYMLMAAGGACLYVGLKKKGDSFKPLAWALLVFGWFMAVYYSDSYFGWKIRPMIGYQAGETSALLSAATWTASAVLYAGVSFAVSRLLDDSDPERLIAIGAALLIAAIASDAVMQWLKQVGSRPRPKYLLTLKDPASEYRNWWQMVPYLADQNDNFQSWPSGHMSIVSTLFALPLLTDCMKVKTRLKPRVNLCAFILVCIFILLCGYNRIHMTNHFLSDVCFGTLNTLLITAGFCRAFTKSLRKEIS